MQRAMVPNFFLLTVAGPSRCNECSGSNSSICSSRQIDDQFCDGERISLGTTHCASAVGKYMNSDKGENVPDMFFRGCVNCNSKCSETAL